MHYVAIALVAKRAHFGAVRSMEDVMRVAQEMFKGQAACDWPPEVICTYPVAAARVRVPEPGGVMTPDRFWHDSPVLFNHDLREHEGLREWWRALVSMLLGRYSDHEAVVLECHW